MADGSADDPPPIGGSWRALYATVLIAFALEVIALAALSRAFG
jgi:hypothetical protein